MSCDACEGLKGRVAHLECNIEDLKYDLGELEDDKLNADVEMYEGMEEKLTAAAAIVYRLHCAKDICLCAICAWHRRHR